RIAWPVSLACRAWVTTSSSRTRGGDRLVTRDESLEATALVQDTGVMIVSLGLSRAAHAALVQLIPALKAPVAPGQLLPLALVFVAAWVFAAERAGVHRL